MWKRTIKYSLLCGLFLIILFMISVQLGTNPLLDKRHMLFDVVILFLFVYAAIREFRTYVNDNVLHFWQGMTIGFFIYLPASIIFGIGIYIILELDSLILLNYKSGTIAFVENQKKISFSSYSDQDINNLKQSILDLTIFHISFTTMIKKIITGFFITPLLSLILRKKS